MSLITKEALEEYKKIYKKQTGEDLSDQEALESATKLLNLIQLVYKPVPENYSSLNSKSKNQTL